MLPHGCGQEEYKLWDDRHLWGPLTEWPDPARSRASAPAQGWRCPARRHYRLHLLLLAGGGSPRPAVEGVFGWLRGGPIWWDSPRPADLIGWAKAGCPTAEKPGKKRKAEEAAQDAELEARAAALRKGPDAELRRS